MNRNQRRRCGPHEAECLDLPPLEAVRWGSLLRLGRRPEQQWPRETLDQGLIRGAGAGRDIAFVSDPGLIRRVLDGDGFDHSSAYAATFRRLSGAADVMNQTGESWRRHRRAMAPLTGPETVRLAGDRAAAIVERLERDFAPARSETIDAVVLSYAATLHHVFLIVFGEAPNADCAALILKTARIVSDTTNQRDPAPVGLALRALGDAALAQTAKGWARDDHPFASLISGAGVLDREALTANLRLFLAAGHETTAAVLAWTLDLLARRPDLQEELRAEARLAAEDRRLTRSVLFEVMRLYPPGPLVMCEATETTELGGETLPRGAVVAACIYAAHRRPDCWDAPSAFDPGRFIEPDAPAPAFLPFGAGPRTCPGARLSMALLPALLGEILQRWRLHGAATAPPKPVVDLSLRPSSPVRVAVEAIGATV